MGERGERSDARKIVAAFALHFLSVAAITVSRTYIDLLFLSTYPRDWLPQFFLAQTGAILALTFATKPLIARGSARINASLLGGFALTIAASYLLVLHPLPGSAFAVCTWLALAGTLSGVLAWTAVGDAFDMRQFKRLAKWINAAGSSGALVLGALVPLLIAGLGADGLLFVLVGLLCAAAACLLALPTLPGGERGGGGSQKKAPRSPLAHPLFRQLAMGASLLMAVDTFADYALKAELAAAYSKDGIGRFMGPFYGIASVLTLVLQLGASDALLRAFGLTGLLAPLPMLALLTAVGVAVLPGLWSAAALRLGQNVTRYALDNLGREIGARPLPGAIRRSGKLFLKGLATPIGAGFGAIFLWLLAERVGLRGVAIATIAASALWVWVVTRTSGAYRETLSEAVGTGRLALGFDETSPATLQAARTVAEQILERDESDEAALFGLQLLEQAGEGDLPGVVAGKLAAASSAVRAAAVRVTRSFRAASVATLLVARLEQEDDAEVRWLLFERLAALAPQRAVAAAQRVLADPAGAPEVRAGAILVLLADDEADHASTARAALQRLVESADPAERAAAARALGALPPSADAPGLERLIQDDDARVSVMAIRGAGARKAADLAEALAARLGVGQPAYYAAQALLCFGEAALPAVRRVAVGDDPTARRAALRLLAKLPGAAAEGALVELLDDADVSQRMVLARATAERARRQPLGAELSATAKEQLQRAAKAVQTLGGAAAGQPEGIAAELMARQQLARERLLYWFAALTQPDEVLELVPLLLRAGDESRRAAAMELLDALADRGTRPALAALETVGKASSAGQLDDPWMAAWLAAAAKTREEGAAMDTTQRVMLLRRVSLFASLPGEMLVTIAESCETRELTADERIFSAGDAPDGLYVIAAGRVRIARKDKTLVELAPSEFFGEVALLDDDPRMADAIAQTDGLALFMDRDVFHRITEELPEVLRAVNRTLIRYLKHAEQASGRQTLF